MYRKQIEDETDCRIVRQTDDILGDGGCLFTPMSKTRKETTSKLKMSLEKKKLVDKQMISWEASLGRVG